MAGSQIRMDLPAYGIGPASRCRYRRQCPDIQESIGELQEVLVPSAHARLRMLFCMSHGPHYVACQPVEVADPGLIASPDAASFFICDEPQREVGVASARLFVEKLDSSIDVLSCNGTKCKRGSTEGAESGQQHRTFLEDGPSHPGRMWPARLTESLLAPAGQHCVPFARPGSRPGRPALKYASLG